MSIPSVTKSKYRPVLTASEILKILELAKTESPMSDISYSLVSKLSAFQAKIENDGVSPAYTPKPAKPSILESLEGTLDDNNLHNQTKEEYWKECYIKWTEWPQACSLNVIRASDEHRYLNDLMSPEEILTHESKIL